MGLSITFITIIKNSFHYPEILKTEMDDIYHGTKPWNVLAVYVTMWGQVIEFNGSGFASWCFGATNLMDGPGGGVVAVLLQSSETLKREADMRTRAQS